MNNKIVEFRGNHYKFLGMGCKATGAEKGWKMSENIYFRCSECGYILSGDPTISESCLCGNLHKDSDYGRFGSKYGDDSIEVYSRLD